MPLCINLGRRQPPLGQDGRDEKAQQDDRRDADAALYNAQHPAVRRGRQIIMESVACIRRVITPRENGVRKFGQKSVENPRTDIDLSCKNS